MTTPSATCPTCTARGQNWQGDPPVCGFSTGFFRPDNWNCGTLNALREIAERDPKFSEDQSVATIPHDGEFLILGWYKRRGKTEVAYVVSGEDVKPLTLELAEEIIQANKCASPSGTPATAGGDDRASFAKACADILALPDDQLIAAIDKANSKPSPAAPAGVFGKGSIGDAVGPMLEEPAVDVRDDAPQVLVWTNHGMEPWRPGDHWTRYVRYEQHEAALRRQHAHDAEEAKRQYGLGVSAGKKEALKYTPSERASYGIWAVQGEQAKADAEEIAKLGEALEWLECYFELNIDGGGSHGCPWCYAHNDEDKWADIKHDPNCVIGHAFKTAALKREEEGK